MAKPLHVTVVIIAALTLCPTSSEKYHPVYVPSSWWQNVDKIFLAATSLTSCSLAVKKTGSRRPFTFRAGTCSMMSPDKNGYPEMLLSEQNADQVYVNSLRITDGEKCTPDSSSPENNFIIGGRYRDKKTTQRKTYLVTTWILLHWEHCPKKDLLPNLGVSSFLTCRFRWEGTHQSRYWRWLDTLGLTCLQ